MELEIISIASIIGMAVTAFISIGLPIGLLIVGKVHYKAKLSSFFTGCLVFFVMALVLEQGLHAIVLTTTGDVITGNKFLYALYGATCAAVFEEVGRFVALKYVLKKDLNFENAFMYGVGHGGFEAIVIVGITMINNIATSIMINAGTFPNTLEYLDEATRTATYGQLEALWTTPSYMFYMGGIERVFAIVAQIALTLIMFEAVKNNRKVLVALPFVLHFLLDFVAVILADIAPASVVEVIVGVISVGTLYLSHKLAK